MIDYLPANVRKSLRKPATAKSFLEIPHRPAASPFRRPERASLSPAESLREVSNLKKRLFKAYVALQKVKSICFRVYVALQKGKNICFRVYVALQKGKNICFRVYVALQKD